MSSATFFDSAIPYGNGLFRGIEENGGILELSMAPQAKNAAESLWFCFRLNLGGLAKPGRKLRIIARNFHSSLGGIPAEKVNIAARLSGGAWRRLGPGRTLVLPDGRADAAWETELLAESMDFAFCFPYGTPELDALLEGSGGYFAKDVIGTSPEGRDILRLSNNYGCEEAKKPGVYLMARQHSGETSGSWALHGFLKRLAERKAQGLTAWCVPLANADGVEGGHYGKDSFPIDVNRAWGVPPMRYENKVFQDDIAIWSKRSEGLLALDFHSPCGAEDDGVYCFCPKGPNGEADAKSLEWAGRLQRAISLEYAAPDFARVANYHSRWESPLASFYKFMCGFCKMPALSFEFPYSQIRGRVLELEDYEEIGARMADAVLAFSE